MQKELLDDIIQWDVASWSKALDYWEKKVSWQNVHHCLELGAGKGGLSLWLALKGKQVVCSDIANVENNSSSLHKKYNIVNKIKYENISADNIPYEDYFDLVIFKSMLGVAGKNNNMEAIERVMKQIYTCLKPGGILLFAENLKATALHNYLREKYTRWGTSWNYISLEQMEKLLQNFSSYDIKTTGFSAALGRNEMQRNILAQIDQLMFNCVTPNSWKYIAYGVAVK